MKSRPKIIVAVALLLALLAWAAARHGTRSDCAGQSCGTCCLSLPMLDGMAWHPVTNGAATNGAANQSSTNLAAP